VYPPWVEPALPNEPMDDEAYGSGVNRDASIDRVWADMPAAAAAAAAAEAEADDG
jgi:hypothetical protein